jgi:hypothetical protein
MTSKAGPGGNKGEATQGSKSDQVYNILRTQRESGSYHVNISRRYNFHPTPLQRPKQSPVHRFLDINTNHSLPNSHIFSSPRKCAWPLLQIGLLDTFEYHEEACYDVRLRDNVESGSATVGLLRDETECDVRVLEEVRQPEPVGLELVRADHGNTALRKKISRYEGCPSFCVQTENFESSVQVSRRVING